MIDVGKKVLETEGKAILKLMETLGEDFEKAVELLYKTKGRVVITGIGKSGLIGQKISATLTSTGTPSVFMHAADAVHGDIGTIMKEDSIIAISYSGETSEVVNLLEFLKRLGNPLIAITGNPESPLGKHADVVLNVKIEKEACPIGLVPTTSTTVTLALGDALAVSLMVKKGFTKEDFAYYHPGGKIGKKILKIKHFMHIGNELPIVKEEWIMSKVLQVMNEKKFGVAIVVDENNKLTGIITDGDLRRAVTKFGDITNKKAVDCMHKNPLTIEKDELLVKALNILEEKKITSLIVADKEKNVLGLIHLHDLWRTQML